MSHFLQFLSVYTQNIIYKTHAFINQLAISNEWKMLVLFPRIWIFRRIVSTVLVHAVNQQKSIVLCCSIGYYTNCREQFVLIPRIPLQLSCK